MKKTIHQSSKHTDFFKYMMLFSPVVMGLAVYYFLAKESPDFFNVFAVVLLWQFMQGLMAFPRLKRVLAKQDGIYIDPDNENLFVPYKDIEYVSKSDYTSPMGVTVKYKNKNGHGSQKVSYVIDKNSSGGLQDDSLTNFIKQKIKEVNPNIKHPSTLKNIFITMLLSAPVLLAALYFFIYK